MGFPTVYYCVLLPGPLVVLLQILDQIRLFFFTLLHFLGIQNPSELPQPTADETIFRVSSADVSYMPSTPASIKKKLPVVKFSAFQRKLPTDLEPSTCAICLCGFKGRQEVRVLGNCCHPFHKGCIDKWVDLGQLTCPLCRSRLLPRSCTSSGLSSTPFLPSRESSSLVRRI